MLDTNHYKNSSCAFAEQLVAYLYDEADEREKTIFETHLTGCDNCAEELSTFGFVRNSIQHWRAEDFMPLATPPMEIALSGFPETAAAAAGRRSWLAGLRHFFTLSPAWTAAAAFAILTIFVGAGLFIKNFSGTTDVAGSSINSEKSTSPSPASLNKIEQPQEVAANGTVKQNIDGGIIRTADKKSGGVTAPNVAPKNLIAKAQNKLQSAPKGDVNTRSVNSYASVHRIKGFDIGGKTLMAKNQKVPKFSEADEMEDTSLRLSDLMAEVEEKE